MTYNDSCIYLLSIIFSSFLVTMIGNNGDKREIFLELKSKLGLYLVEFTKPRNPPAKKFDSNRNATNARFWTD